MNVLLSLTVILSLSVVSAKRIHLVPGDLINIQLLEKLQSEKRWTSYIDELVSNIPDTNTLESMYANLSIAVAVALHWCSIPRSYLGVYQNASVNTPMIARYNVSDWLPCGVIMLQYHTYPTTDHRTVFTVQVNQQFFIKTSILESDLTTLSMDMKQPTYLPIAQHMAFIRGNC